MAPVPNQYPVVHGAIPAHSIRDDQTFVAFFNNANPVLYGLDNSAKLNIWVNDKSVGQLGLGEHIQVILPNGNHRVTLKHLDLFYFTSQHDLELTGEPTFVEVRPTVVSNHLKAYKNKPPAFW